VAISEGLVDLVKMTMVGVPERAVLSPAALPNTALGGCPEFLYFVSVSGFAGPALYKGIEFSFHPLHSLYVHKEPPFGSLIV
jgi:hypothetical protein